MDIHSLFGLNLQRLRRERGFSQEQLALMAGHPRAYLSGAEAGRRNVTIQTIASLARALEVKPGDLLLEPTKGHESK